MENYVCLLLPLLCSLAFTCAQAQNLDDYINGADRYDAGSHSEDWADYLEPNSFAEVVKRYHSTSNRKKEPFLTFTLGMKRDGSKLSCTCTQMSPPPVIPWLRTGIPKTQALFQKAQQTKPSKQSKPASSQRPRVYGGGRRFPWESMPDTMCYRQPCKHDKDCCRRFNKCDVSVRVCTDCWHGSPCKDETDCCMKYKYCVKPKGWSTAKCVAKL